MEDGRRLAYAFIIKGMAGEEDTNDHRDTPRTRREELRSRVRKAVRVEHAYPQLPEEKPPWVIDRSILGDSDPTETPTDAERLMQRRKNQGDKSDRPTQKRASRLERVSRLASEEFLPSDGATPSTEATPAPDVGQKATAQESSPSASADASTEDSGDKTTPGKATRGAGKSKSLRQGAEGRPASPVGMDIVDAEETSAGKETKEASSDEDVSESIIDRVADGEGEPEQTSGVSEMEASGIAQGPSMVDILAEDEPESASSALKPSAEKTDNSTQQPPALSQEFPSPPPPTHDTPNEQLLEEGPTEDSEASAEEPNSFEAKGPTPRQSPRVMLGWLNPDRPLDPEGRQEQDLLSDIFVDPVELYGHESAVDSAAVSSASNIPTDQQVAPTAQPEHPLAEDIPAPASETEASPSPSQEVSSMDGERNQQVQSGGADESPPGTHDLNLDLDRGDDFGQGELDDLDIEEYADGDEEGAGPGYRFPRGLADALDAIDLDDEVEEDWPEQPPSLDPDDATAGPILTGSPESEGHIQDGPDGVAVQHELQNEGEEASGEDSGLEAEGSRGALRTTGVFGATRRALAGLRRELAKQDQAASTSYNRSRGAVSADEGGELSEGAVEDIGAPESALSSPNTAPLDDPASITPSGAAAPETPREHALVASRGVFAGPSPLSLATPNLKSDRDELNDALAAFASLQPGQSGFIRVGLRSYPEFRGEAAEYVHATRHGTDPKAKSNPLSLLLFSIAWVVQAIWFHGNKNSNSFGNTPPPPPPWKKSSAVKPLNPSQMSDEARQALDDATKKSRDSSFFDTTLYIGVFGESDDRGALEQIRHDVETGFESYTTPHQRIVFEEVSGWDAAIGYMPSSPDGRLALSATEAGEIARIPDDLTNPHGVRVARSRVRQLPIANPITFDDPLNPPPGIIPVGKINSGTEDEAFIGIRNSELDRHALIAGRTGTGKSVLLEWLIFGIAKANYPVVLIDPHGSLADNVLHILADHCQERLDDIVVVDFADTEWPVAMNPLDINHFEQIEPTVKSVMEMLDRQMALGGGNAPRATTYARQAITVLAEANLHLKDPNTKCTLLQVNTFFNDEAFRQMVVQLCSNPSIRETFDPDNGPFEQLAPKAQLEYSAPIERAFRPLGASGALGNVFAAGENRLNFTELIRSNKIILLKLSRFAANKDVSTFVGSLVTPYMLQSMDDWGRKKDADSGEFVGTGARLIIDEAPTICGPGSSIMEVLSQARKWDMGAIAACQFPTQFDKAVEQEFYSNTASKITLALDPAGVGGLAQSISGDSGLVSKNDVISLPNYFGYANLMLPYGGSGPFSLATLAPIEPTRDASHRQRIEYVHQRSRALVCNQRDEVYARRQTQLADLKQALHRILAERVAQDAPEERSSVVNINPDEIEEQQWS